MFSEPSGLLNNSKINFLQTVNDSFGKSIENDCYEPFERDLQQLLFAWKEEETKKDEILALFLELRLIL